jgi:hypothetical protein
MAPCWTKRITGVTAWLFAVGFAAEVMAQAGDIPLSNWTVPGGSDTGKMVDATAPRPFIGLPPCRLLDTRGTPIGGGIFANSEARDYTFPGSCGIPTGSGEAIALSLNLTVTGSPAAPPGAFILAYPTNSPPSPIVSLLNFQAGQTIANAAIVPTSSGGEITINVSHSTHVIVDVNGYFAASPGTSGNFFRIDNNSNSQSIFTTNASTSCALNCGITASISSTSGGYAISGFANGLTGVNYGVFGRELSSSPNSAGVLGVDLTNRPANTTPLETAGVRGESTTGYGILGVAGPQGVGAGGLMNDAAGDMLAGGVFGWSSGLNYGVYSVGPYGGSGAKYFVEPHPEKAGMVIRYISLEGRESGTYFRGRGKFQNGVATIEVPEDFRLVTDAEGLSIQVTPIGHLATVAVLRIGLDGIVVKGSRNVEFFYTVNGMRKTHKDLEPVGVGNEYTPHSAEARMPAYLTAGQKAMLISNGTYREDGTVNLDTARKLGWDRIWAEKKKSIAP